MFSSPSLTTSLAAAPVPCRKQPAVLSTLTAPKLTYVQLVLLARVAAAGDALDSRLAGRRALPVGERDDLPRRIDSARAVERSDAATVAGGAEADLAGVRARRSAARATTSRARRARCSSRRPGSCPARACHAAIRPPEGVSTKSRRTASLASEAFTGAPTRAPLMRRTAYGLVRRGAIHEEQAARAAGELRLVARHDQRRAPRGGVRKGSTPAPAPDQRLVLQVGEGRDGKARVEREAAAVGLVRPPGPDVRAVALYWPGRDGLHVRASGDGVRRGHDRRMRVGAELDDTAADRLVAGQRRAGEAVPAVLADPFEHGACDWSDPSGFR